MSIMSECMYGQLQDVVEILAYSNPTLSETQSALLNAMKHIVALESKIENLEFRLSGMEESKS